MRAQTWDGLGVGSSWSTANNWNPNGVPASTANLTFNAANADGKFDITLDGTRTARSLTFSSTGTSGFTFDAGAGGTLTISNSAGILNNNASTQTFNVTVTTSASQTWNAAVGGLTFNNVTLGNTLTLSGAGDIAINGTLALTGNRTITNNSAGSVTIDNVTGANRTLTIGGTGTTAVTGAIATGSGALAKTGSGVLTLSGANVYTGTATVSAGILNIQNSSALGTGSGGTTVASNAALQLQNGITVSGETLTLSGSGVSNGGALENVSGNNTWAGIVTLNRATRINSDADTLTISGNISGSQNLTVGGAATIDITGVIGIGSRSLTKDGTGTLVLSGVNTYTGSTTVSAGVLNLQNGAALGAGSGGVTVASGAALQLQNDITVSGKTLTLSGAGIANDGALRNLSGDNTWAGTVTLTSPTRINSDAGTLTLSGAVQGSGQDLTVGGAGNTAISGVIGTGAGGLTYDGTGTLILSGVNTYAGATTINSGTLSVGADNALSGNTAVSVAGGATLELGGNSDTVGSIAGDGSVVLGSGALTAGGNNTSTTFSGIASGTGSLTKAGTGTLVLAGANTYTGGTNVSAGTLQLGASNGMTDGTAVAIAAGSTLNLNGYSQTVGSLSGAGTLQLASGTLIVGSGGASSTFLGAFAAGDTGVLEKTGTGTLTFGTGMNLSSGGLVLNGGTLNLGGFTSTFSSLTVTGNSTLDFSGTSILNLNSVTVASGVTLTVTDWADTVDYFYSLMNPGSTNLGRIVFTGFPAGSTSWQSWDQEVTPVPEPAAEGAVLMLSGLVVVGWTYLRRRSRRV